MGEILNYRFKNAILPSRCAQKMIAAATNGQIVRNETRSRVTKPETLLGWVESWARDQSVVSGN